MRVLTGSDLEGELSDAQLDDLYATPSTPWLRVNMISTLDGAGTGPDGRSGSINNEPDHRVFAALRRWCDVVVVGAGTARDEGYAGLDRPLVLVTRRGEVPEQLRDEGPGQVLLATCASADLTDARRLLGDDSVLVLGEDTVDLALLKQRLHERGLGRILSEGGPHLLGDLLAADAADELDLTTVPRLLAGDHRRIVTGADVDVPLSLALLLEEQGTLLGRWVTAR